jgi:hypothetical protein
MSDFLTNLAARALGAPTLRPRLRSRFEPAPATGDVPFESAPPRLSSGRAATVDASFETPRRTSVDFAQAVQPATQQRQPSIIPSETTKQRVEESHTAPPTSAHIAVHPPQQAAPPQRRTLVTAATTTIISPRSTPPPAHVSSQPITETVTKTLIETIAETREIIIREPAVLGPESATPPPTPPRHRYDEQPPRIERTVVSRELHFANSAPRPARGTQSRMEVPAQSEPVIQVSIGRVEVRAITPPPAAKPNRTPRAAAMSIDDYAARRNAKGRR